MQVKEMNKKTISFEDFIPQDYPLLQTRMIQAIIDDVNKVIKKEGVDKAIYETKNVIKILQRNNPTITQEQMIYFYRTILMKLNGGK